MPHKFVKVAWSAACARARIFSKPWRPWLLRSSAPRQRLNARSANCKLKTSLGPLVHRNKRHDSLDASHRHSDIRETFAPCPPIHDDWSRQRLRQPHGGLQRSETILARSTSRPTNVLIKDQGKCLNRSAALGQPLLAAVIWHGSFSATQPQKSAACSSQPP